MYTPLHQNNKEYTFYSIAHRSFSKIHHTLGNKPKLYIFKERLKSHTCVLSEHTAIKLKIDRRNSSEYINSWRLNASFLNDEWVKEEKHLLELKENEYTTQQY